MKSGPLTPALSPNSLAREALADGTVIAPTKRGRGSDRTRAFAGHRANKNTRVGVRGIAL